MKKVVICASASLQKEIKFWVDKLVNDGYEVIKSPEIIKEEDFWSRYGDIHSDHYKKIKEADMVFVMNANKDGIKNYIGPSVFAEIAFAIGLNNAFNKNIEIYCLNQLPQKLAYSKELDIWEKMGWIKLWSKN